MTTPDDESEPEPVLPTFDRVLRRAFCLSAIVFRSFTDEATDSDDLRSRNERLLPWLRELGAEPELEPWEAAVLAKPLGSLETQTRVDGSWLSEGLAVLAWALSRFDLPPQDESVNAPNLTAALELLEPGAPRLFRTSALRTEEEIAFGARRALTLHWRLRQFSLAPEPMDFASFAQTAWPGMFSVEGITLADNDLSLRGLPISQASSDVIREASGIAFERHRAFNWLLGYDSVYSETDTST